MISEREKYEQFENYLKGLLDREANAALEENLRKDPGLGRELEEYRQAHRLIFEGGLLDLRRELETLHALTLKTGRNRRWGRNILISAGILVTGVLLYVYLNRHYETAPEKGRLNETVSKPEITAEQAGEENRQILSPDNTGHDAIVNKPVTDSIRHNVAGLTVKPSVAGAGKVKDKLIESISKPVETNTADQDIPLMVLPEADADSPADNRPADDEIKDRPAIADCENVIISCEFSAENTCSDRPQGRILFITGSLRGGKPPYEFSITGGTAFEARALFDKLQGGSYRLAIRDANQCMSETGMAKISDMECDFRFAPGLGEVWEIPFITDKEGKLNLYSKDGKLLYSALVGPYSGKTWDGRSLQGEMLPLGAYMFQLAFKDGSFYQGSVTIIK